MGPKLAYIYIVVRRYDPKSLYQMKKTFGHSGIGVKKDFCRGFPPPIILTATIYEIFLKVVLNSITPNPDT
jgi:hypothetical protein